MKDTVLFKRYDEADNPYWCMTRVNAYKRYTRTIKPLNDLLNYLGYINERTK